MCVVVCSSGNDVEDMSNVTRNGTNFKLAFPDPLCISPAVAAPAIPHKPCCSQPVLPVFEYRAATSYPDAR